MFVCPRRRSRGIAADVFAAFGVGERKSYKLVEGYPVPAFVLGAAGHDGEYQHPGAAHSRDQADEHDANALLGARLPQVICATNHRTDSAHGR